MKNLYPLLIIIALAYWSCEEELDTTPPTVSITSHQTGQTVNEIVTITVSSEDDDGVSKVEFYMENLLVLTDTESPYEYQWNTTQYDDGSDHIVKVISYDNSDNSTEVEITLQVDNSTAVPQGGNVTSVTYTLADMTVEWEESPDGDFKDYKVLHSETESGDRDTLETYTDNSVTSHIITDFDPTHENWFWVQVTDTLGLSSIGTGMTNDIDSHPTQSTIYNVLYQNNSFIVSWSKNNDNDFLSYILYESSSQDMSSSSLVIESQNVNDTVFTVTGIIVGETKYYHIITKDIFGLESVSDSKVGYTHLFEANFTNDWLHENNVGHLILSDMNGNFITMKTWSGNESFYVPVPDNINSVPDKFMVTTVAIEDNGDAYITTNMNIPVRSTWTWGKHYPDEPDFGVEPDYVDINFTNVPDQNAYALSTLWDYYSGGTMANPFNVRLRTETSDIYLKLKTISNSDRYIFLEDISAGQETVDLSNMQLNDSSFISIDNSVGVGFYLYGFPEPGSHYAGRFRLERFWGSNSEIFNSLTAFYPPGMFTDYRTSIYYYDTENNDEYWYESVYGDIPSEFTKLDADFDWISTDPTDFSISISSGNDNFDQIGIRWSLIDDSYNSARWNVYGPNDLTSFSLPEIPDSIISMYPHLSRESFRIDFASLREYSPLDSYDDVIELVFKTSTPFYDFVNILRARHKNHEDSRSLRTIDNDSNEKELYENELFFEDQYHHRLRYSNK